MVRGYWMVGDVFPSVVPIISPNDSLFSRLHPLHDDIIEGRFFGLEIKSLSSLNISRVTDLVQKEIRDDDSISLKISPICLLSARQIIAGLYWLALFFGQLGVS